VWLSFAIFSTVIVYFGVLKMYTNTFHLPRAIREERSRRKLEDLYNALYERREDYVYHYNWAKQRGDSGQMKGLEEKVKDCDKELDEVEEKVKKMYKEHGVGFAS